MLSWRRSWCLLPWWQVISGQQFSLLTLLRFFFPAIDIIFFIWSCRSYVNCGRDVSLRKVLRTIPWLGDLWNVLYPCPMFMFIMLRKVARLLNHVQMSLQRQLLLCLSYWNSMIGKLQHDQRSARMTHLSGWETIVVPFLWKWILVFKPLTPLEFPRPLSPDPFRISNSFHGGGLDIFWRHIFF